MTVPTPTRQLASLVLAVLCLALAVPAAGLAAEGEAGQYKEETLQAFERQLAKHAIASAEFNKKVRSVRITAKDGTLYLIHYEKKGAPAIQSKLKAANVSYTVIKPEGKKSKHLRLIIGIIVIVLVVAGVIAFFVRRRSRLAD
jgi:ATP-dependent Zn protease